MAVKLKLLDKGNPSAFWDEHTPTNEEIEEHTIRTGEYDPDSVFFPRVPSIYDGDTRAVLRDEHNGKTIRYDYRDGKCYSENGDELPYEYVEAAHRAGISEGNASTEEDLKKLISEEEPLIEDPGNVTLVTPQDDDDEM